MTQNASAPRNGVRIESIFQSRAAPPLSWGVCSPLVRRLVARLFELVQPTYLVFKVVR